MTLGCTRLSARRRIVLPLALAGPRGGGDLRRAALLERGLRGVHADAAASHAAGAGARRCSNQALLPFRLAGGFFLLAPALLVVFFIRRYLFAMWGVVVK